MPTRLDLELSFDDILLLPRYSELESRNDPDLSVQLGHIKLKVPLVSSPMDSITGKEMLVAMDSVGGLGILTRYINHPYRKDEIDKQTSEIKWAKKEGAKYTGCAIGIKYNVARNAAMLLDEGCDIICLDVAHGNHIKMYQAIEEVLKLKDHYTFTLMAGNVCTVDAARRFSAAGIEVTKIGIGPGASCTTRRVTGYGRPQLSAILDCSDCETQTIADGGLRETGDMVKALWAGADACMIGYMLAGTSATPDIDGGKVYRGMSSRTVSNRSDIADEGVDVKVDYTGDTVEKLEEYIKGIKSGLAMGGAHDIKELRDCECVRVSPLSIKETEPICLERKTDNV